METFPFKKAVIALIVIMAIVAGVGLYPGCGESDLTTTPAITTTIPPETVTITPPPETITITLPSETVTITPTPTSTRTPPTKLIPAYTLDIKYPAEEGSVVYVEQGGSVTLQVTVRSLVDEPIKIRLNLTAPTSVPAFVQFVTDEEYRTVEPGDTISTEMTITVSENAPLGSFFLGITCELYEPVEERSGEAIIFTFTVTGS